MIATLRGSVIARNGSELVVEVHGVGYLVLVPHRFALGVALGEEIRLHTAMIVRDDHIGLCGFGSDTELSVFGLLRGVTGVGPKSALAILSDLSIAQVREAVMSESDAVFRAVSGIGPKTAKLIVLSLQGAFDGTQSMPETPVSRSDQVVRQSVTQALSGLGWQEKTAKSAVDEAMNQNPEAAVDASALLRLALGILGPQTNREARS